MRRNETTARKIKDIELSVQPRFMNRIQASRYLNLTPGSLSNLHVQGKGPARYKRGGRTYYLQADLDAWILAGRIA